MALFGIKTIEYCQANALAFSGAYNQFYGVASEPTNTFTNICDVVKNRATLSIEQQVVSKEVLYTSRLVFVTDTDPMLASDYYAFVVTTNAGERILIGAQNRPRTIVTTAQNVAATAGDLTAYTTTVEWQTNYRPLRLPVTVTPVTDTREFDICCGQIAQPVAPDTRQFDICCGQIAQPVAPDTRQFDICCGQIDYSSYIPPEPDYQHINPNIPTRLMKIITAEEQPGTFQNRWIYSADNILFGTKNSTGSNVTKGFHWDPDWIYFEVIKDIPGMTTLDNCSYNVMEANSFSEADIDTTHFELIYKQEAPTVPVGYKQINKTIHTVDETTPYFNIMNVGGNVLRERQWWVILSFDGVTKIVTKIGIELTSQVIRLVHQPCYVKVILYGNDEDFAKYNIVPLNIANYTPIYSGKTENQVIGFYTAAWQGTV